MASHDDHYFDDDGGRPKEEPDCGGCTDRGWVAPWGIRRVLVWLWDLNPPGTDPAWRRPRGGDWPCPDCNPTRLDVAQHTLRHWWRGLWRWPRRAASAFDDEPPF